LSEPLEVEQRQHGSQAAQNEVVVMLLISSWNRE